MKKIKHFLFVDFESYYDNEYSLRHMSPPEYILDRRFQTLLMAAFDLTWSAPRVIQAEDIPAFLAKYPAEETACCSHNFLFDGSILSWRYNWIAGRLCDTLGMARALRSFKSNALGAVAKELFGYNSKGDIIHKMKGLDRAGIMRAGLWPDFQVYGMNDVRICSQIYMRLIPEFPVEERRIMDLVLRTAIDPVLCANVPLLEQHLDELRKRKARLLRECNYDKAALMSTAQFKEALENLGVEIQHKTSSTGKWIPQFSKTDPFMSDLLYYDRSLDADVNYQVQTLTAARLSQKSTLEETRCEQFINIAKLPWANGATLPVALRYGGARTHRLSGEWGLNQQNLPKDRSKSKLREAIMAPAGHTMITADLAQIEARIVAKLCGEVALTESFRRGDDVYAEFAKIVFHRHITKKDHPAERFLGKTAILGLGYNCGAERYYVMVTTQARQAGISLEGIFDERIAATTVNTYRTLFAQIPKTWRKLDHYLTHYINSDNVTQQAEWGPVTFMSRRIKLPNNMYLRYDKDDQSLYGAKILENVTQALARIIVMQAAVRLSRKGLRFCMQAHDELTFVVPDNEVEEAKAIILKEMINEPTWLEGLPLAVEIGEGQNYGGCK